MHGTEGRSLIPLKGPCVVAFAPQPHALPNDPDNDILHGRYVDSVKFILTLE